MTVLSIVTWPDRRLSRVCEPVAPDANLARLASDMLETMYAAPGRGLAAPQVGVMQRLFVMDVTWKEGPHAPRICINPELLATSPDLVSGEEACLSIPGIAAEVPRHSWIELAWTDSAGVRHERRMDGFEAICAQHELDHLNGVVIFDRLEDAAKEQALAAYEARA